MASPTWPEWFAQTTQGDIDAHIARRTGASRASAGRWRRTPPPPESVITIGREYRGNIVEGLVAAGHLRETEAHIPRLLRTPHDFESQELLDEIAHRLQAAEATTPRPEDFDLAAMSGMSEGERLRNAMNAEQETPESFYDGDEPA